MTPESAAFIIGMTIDVTSLRPGRTLFNANLPAPRRAGRQEGKDK
jgi:hypothetical protein